MQWVVLTRSGSPGADVFLWQARTAYQYYYERLGHTVQFAKLDPFDNTNVLLEHQICAAHVLQKVVGAGWEVPAVKEG